MSKRQLRFLAPLFALLLVLSACGGDSDDATTEVDAGQVDDAPIPVEPDGGIGDGAEPLPGSDEGAGDADAGADAPIPVEPDGGIGDGAEPLPGSDEGAGDTGDWHGAQVAETNCPGIEFIRVEASAFTFSVPVGFVDQQVQGIDSEVAIWSNDSIEVSYDYGWYSAPLSDLPGAQVQAIDYSGVEGELVIVTGAAGPNERNLVGVYFAEVEADDFGQANRLNLLVQHDDPADEIIGRCIVGSIEWTPTAG